MPLSILSRRDRIIMGVFVFMNIGSLTPQTFHPFMGATMSGTLMSSTTMGSSMPGMETGVGIGVGIGVGVGVGGTDVALGVGTGVGVAVGGRGVGASWDKPHPIESNKSNVMPVICNNNLF